MTYKFRTRVKGFILGPYTIEDPIWIEWYCYTPDKANGECVTGFNYKQVEPVKAYMEATSNFEQPINYQPVDMFTLPLTESWHFVEDPQLEFPEYLILSQEQHPEQKNGMAPYMEIVWCDEEGAVQHNYNLEFSIIGKVLGV